MSIEEIAESISQLIKKYGYSIKDITEKIGLDTYEVTTLDFENLDPKLKELVTEGKSDLKIAILSHIIFKKVQNAPDRTFPTWIIV